MFSAGGEGTWQGIDTSDLTPEVVVETVMASVPGR
jgi:hypothetical protein